MSLKPSKLQRRVGAYMPNGPAYFSRVYAGFAAFCRSRQPWKMAYWPSMVPPEPAEIQRTVIEWEINGVIGFGTKIWETLAATRGLCAVNIEYNQAPVAAIPRVGVDEAAIGRMAAAHFQERGLRHLAAIGRKDTLPANERLAAFEQAARRWCHEPVYRHDYVEQSAVTRWVAGLPTPIGIFCWNDETARAVYFACEARPLNIPRDVAVLGVDNDEVICESLEPMLSSIDGNARQVGYEAGALLERLMEGQPPPDGPVIVPPVGVVSRGSTDMLAVTNPDVVEAVRFIGEHADGSLQVEDVLDHLAMSRSALERQFRATLGRTPRSEINRVIVERTRDMLINTDLSIRAIALRCGYKHANHFTVMFRKQTGQTPSAYRAQSRLT